MPCGHIQLTSNHINKHDLKSKIITIESETAGWLLVYHPPTSNVFTDVEI